MSPRTALVCATLPVLLGLPGQGCAAAGAVGARPFPEGFSSPVLGGDRVFRTGLEDQRLFTYALDRDTGLTLWKREAPRPRRTEFLVVRRGRTSRWCGHCTPVVHRAGAQGRAGD